MGDHSNMRSYFVINHFVPLCVCMLICIFFLYKELTTHAGVCSFPNIDDTKCAFIL
ncbi:hypothetical protein I79_025523 [Cricetulus griseus]|uniref:Uncharacterized protein n=1 Tax=Cricetulus griseus TaxID=10029 RepID=G3INJ8_CRIGR|nr:hypothetical protein I79_025523 [Cricetulus griseus]